MQGKFVLAAEPERDELGLGDDDVVKPPPNYRRERSRGN